MDWTRYKVGRKNEYQSQAYSIKPNAWGGVTLRYEGETVGEYSNLSAAKRAAERHQARQEGDQVVSEAIDLLYKEVISHDEK